MGQPNNRCFDNIVDAAVAHAGGVVNLSELTGVTLEQLSRAAVEPITLTKCPIAGSINNFYASMAGNSDSLFEGYFSAGLSLYVVDLTERRRWGAIVRYLSVYGVPMSVGESELDSYYSLLAMLILDSLVSIGVDLPPSLSVKQVADLVLHDEPRPFFEYREFYLLLQRLVVLSSEVFHLNALGDTTKSGIQLRAFVGHQNMVHRTLVSSLISLVDNDWLQELGCDVQGLQDFLQMANWYLNSALNHMATAGEPCMAFRSRALGAYFKEESSIVE